MLIKSPISSNSKLLNILTQLHQKLILTKQERPCHLSSIIKTEWLLPVDWQKRFYVKIAIDSWLSIAISTLVGWLVVLGLTTLWDSISFYIGPSPKEREKMRERIDESKNVQTSPTRTYCKRSRPLPYCNPNCRTPRHWKFTQHHRTTRPSHDFNVNWRLPVDWH